MKLIIPKYRVSYHGRFYEHGEAFKIDASDADYMKQHGIILEEQSVPIETPRKPGRPAKR